MYNSCQTRHCPTCQTSAKEKWLDARLAEVLPVPYFHFRSRFLRRLCSLRRRGKLLYKGRAALLADEAAWEAWRASLASQSWIVFSQPPPIQHFSPKGCATRPRPGSVWTRQKTAPRDRRDANHRCPRHAKHVLDRFRCLDRFANQCPPQPAA
jgi:hypothetical protein